MLVTVNIMVAQVLDDLWLRSIKPNDEVSIMQYNMYTLSRSETNAVVGAGKKVGASAKKSAKENNTVPVANAVNGGAAPAAQPFIQLQTPIGGIKIGNHSLEFAFKL